MGGMSDERAARLRLARLAEPGDQKLGEALARGSAVELVDRIVRRDLTLPKVDDYRVRLTGVDEQDDAARLDDVGGRFVIPGDSEWPTQLDDLGPTRPVGLFVRGADVRLSALRSVAIVGSRAATQYGLHVATEFATDLADRGWTVVSGGAYGIDAAAHRGALAARGTTVAVMANGVDVGYPLGNVSLFDRIRADGGCLVSELAPGVNPTKPRFLQRNRVIAALTRATLVVEAAHRSGALNTASSCLRLGRQLMAVPGPVTSAMSAGCHRLMRADEGARLVTGVDEVIEEVGPIGALAPPPTVVQRVRDGLDPTSLLVLEAVPVRDPATTPEIARRAGLAAGLVPGVLLRLAAAGLVADRGERGYQLVRGAGDRPRKA
jgi:DNA processing protein